MAPSPISPISEPAPSPLPQYGFGPDVDFKTLVRNNRFVYRVYTPKERSPFADESDPFLVAPKFDQLYARTPVEVTSASSLDPADAAYADVARHMDWTTRASSVYLSTSFSFAWSIWEALRRHHLGMKKDVQIAVIDASMLSGRAATAVELLRKSKPEERNQQYTKWHRFSSESQSVLVYGFIPGNAVLSSIPLLSLLERLPSYLLRTKAQVILDNPLDHVAWNYTDKKQTYRQFCQEMSTRFFNISQELRFRDATGGSMRLALTFLRPWFYKMIVQDFNLAVSTLRDMAIIIAHWGGQWWARDHVELNRILDSMTFTLGEELLQRIKRQDMESSRLHDTVDDLERIIRAHETERLVRPSPIAESCQCASSPITPQASPKLRPRRTISMSLPMSQRGAPGFQLPITPPDSRRNSWAFPKSSPGRPALPNFAFQPLTPPVDWPIQRTRTPSLSMLSRPTLETLPSTPPTPTPMALPMSDETNVITEEPTAWQEEQTYEFPSTPVNSKAEELSLDDHAQPSTSYFPTPPMEQEAPHTPVQKRIDLDGATLVGALPTPPLKSLAREGLRARTLSDLSTGLKIFIPLVPTPRLLFPPSPTASNADDFQSESNVSSPRTLVSPSSPSTLSKTDSTLLEPSSLGSPIRLIGSQDIDKLPPLPPSPAMSWGSAPTLPGSPSGSTQWPKFGHSLWGPNLSLDLGSPVTPGDQVPDSAVTRSSMSDDAVKSPRSNSSVSLPIPTTIEHEQVKVEQLEEIHYLAPRPGISILATPILQAELESDVKGRVSQAARSRHGRPILDTASTVVTGFLVGAFITLFLVSTQRKTLLYLT